MIKAFIIAALTADGFIAQSPDQVSTAWTSKGDKKMFVERTKKAGVIIMGSTTFETFGKPLKDRKNIVYSKDPSKKYEGVEVTNKDPHILMQQLEKEGFSEVAICGGSSIYTLFLEAKLIDTIYLTIEPIMFGKGVTLFNKNIKVNLELLGNTQIDTNTVQFEYKVIYT